MAVDGRPSSGPPSGCRSSAVFPPLRSEDGAGRTERSDRGTAGVKHRLSSLRHRVTRHKDKVRAGPGTPAPRLPPRPRRPGTRGRSRCTGHSTSHLRPRRGKAQRI